MGSINTRNSRDPLELSGPMAQHLTGGTDMPVQNGRRMPCSTQGAMLEQNNTGSHGLQYAPQTFVRLIGWRDPTLCEDATSARTAAPRRTGTG